MATGHGTEPGDEGPLAHVARVASEQSYLDGLVATRRSAWERASGARPQRTPKRLLVSLSHSIEKAVLGGPIEPGASARQLAGVCDRIGEQLELASHGYPDIALRARGATVVTRRRPLPVDELHRSLARLDDDGHGPVEADAIAGDPVVVSSTALHAHGAVRTTSGDAAAKPDPRGSYRSARRLREAQRTGGAPHAGPGRRGGGSVRDPAGRAGPVRPVGRAATLSGAAGADGLPVRAHRLP